MTAPNYAGYSTENDALVQVLADGTNLNAIWAELRQVLATWNAERTALAALLSYGTTNTADAIPQSISDESFELASEFGVPTSLRIPKNYLLLGYTLEDYDRATRFTWKALRAMTVEQVRSAMDGVLAADNKLINGLILRALFDNTTGRVNEWGHTVYGLYSGDGVVPPKFAGQEFDGTHTHYLASGNATIDSSDLEAAFEHITHHGYATEAPGQLLTLLNPAEAKVVSTFKAGVENNNSQDAAYDYIPSAGMPAYLLKQGETLQGNPAPAAYNGLKVEGSFLREVTEDDPGRGVLEAGHGALGFSRSRPSSQLLPATARAPLRLKPLCLWGHYAKQYLDSLAGAVDPTTIQGYVKLYRTHIAPVFGSKPVASITTADVTRFRAELLKPHQRTYVTRGVARAAKTHVRHRSPKTVKHIVGTLKRILDTAVDDQAIAANPVVPGRRHTPKRASAAGVRGRVRKQQPFAHKPLTGSQVAALHDYITRERGNPVYALAVLFAAYTGVRAAELQGLQVQDLTLSDIPGTVGAVRISRTAAKRQGEWLAGTPKTAKSDRVVPLAPWLADDLRDYLSNVHPFAATSRHVTAGVTHHIPHAPLFPGKRTRAGKAAAQVADFDWAKPIVVENLYHNYFQPACKAMGLGSVRFYDLRHTFATLALSAGEHYMQVSKWLGHSSYVLTLSTYADYIRENDTAAPAFTRPVADTKDNVVPIERKAN